MASGNSLFVLSLANSIPAGTLYATPDIIEDGSAPTILIPVMDFDGSQDEHRDWIVTVPSQYANGTGFTFSYKYAMDGTAVDLVDMEFRVLILADTDILTADLGIDPQTAVSIQDTPIVTVTANKFAYSPTGALAKANMGTPVTGNRILIRGTRDVAAASNTDDLQLNEIYVTET